MDEPNSVIPAASEAFLIELFGSVPDDVQEKTVSREDYTKALHKVQDDFGLKQGHPEFISWVFALLGNSPQIEGEE